MQHFDESERYELWMAVTCGIGAARARRLIEAFGSAREVFLAAARGEAEALSAVGEDARAELMKRAREGYIDRLTARLAELSVSVATLSSKEYPALLGEIYDPPTAIYYRGRLERDMPLPIAVVGSREPTQYGKWAANEIAQELASRGATVISGLAYGIDSAAAEAALAADGNGYPTVAVLGSGPDVVYPASNRELYERIVERGAVISEFMPGAQPKKGHFPSRNRLISGLSRGVAVIEAATGSGALITADFALEQGRDVFAVPGRINDPKSAGTNGLIAAGTAKLIMNADDILEEYGISKRTGEKADKVDISSLEPGHAAVYRLLLLGERGFDELCELLGLGAAELNSTLTEMEFSGIIKQSPGRVYGL